MGVDLDDSLVRTARAAAQKQGVQDRVSFETHDLFHTDLGRATVVTTYLLNSVNLRLRPQLFAQLRPGTRIVSHDFNFGNWRPDRKITIDVPDKAYGPPTSDIMPCVVPADVSGIWQWILPVARGEVRLMPDFAQKFQDIEGVVAVQGRQWLPGGARVRGNALSFTVGGSDGPRCYTGRIDGNAIAGEIVLRDGEPPLQWRAVRVKTGKRDISAGTTPRGLPAV